MTMRTAAGRQLPHFNIPTPYGLRKRSPIGTSMTLTAPHTQRPIWWRTNWYAKPYWGIQKHASQLPRVLLDRDVLKRDVWSKEAHLPEDARWERIINGSRWTEDRVMYVEEDGEMHAVNWKLYSDRLNAELQATSENLPSFCILAKGIPMTWKKLDVTAQFLQGLSAREALAQCKFTSQKRRLIFHKLLERVLQGAENKGLDKDKLRVHVVRVLKGKRDKAIDFKSRGYFSWKTKRSSNVLIGVTEDPEMVLPDRTIVPYRTQLALRKAGIVTEETKLDIPAITADGI